MARGRLQTCTESPESNSPDTNPPPTCVCVCVFSSIFLLCSPRSEQEETLCLTMFMKRGHDLPFFQDLHFNVLSLNSILHPPTVFCFVQSCTQINQATSRQTGVKSNPPCPRCTVTSIVLHPLIAHPCFCLHGIAPLSPTLCCS